jgi:hypothetical protein
MRALAFRTPRLRLGVLSRRRRETNEFSAFLIRSRLCVVIPLACLEL